MERLPKDDSDFSDSVTLETGGSPLLRMAAAVSRRLPKVRGAGAIGNLLWQATKSGAPVPIRASVQGFTMLLDPRQTCSGALLFYPQLYDRVELEFLASSLEDGGTFLDIGANVGIYSLVAAREVGTAGKVLAAEADPYNYRLLRWNLEQNDATSAIARHITVSDREGQETLQIHKNRSGSSLLKPASQQITTQSATLHSILNREGLEHVDVAKLDIEGMEYRVLARFFEQASPDLHPYNLIVEENPDLQQTAGGNVTDLLERNRYREVEQNGINRMMTKE